MLRSNWHNNWLLVTFEKFVYFFIPAWVGKTLLKIGPTFTEFAFKRSKRFVNNNNDDSETSKKIQDHQFWEKTGCTWLKILGYDILKTIGIDTSTKNKLLFRFWNEIGHFPFRKKKYAEYFFKIFLFLKICNFLNFSLKKPS